MVEGAVGNELLLEWWSAGGVENWLLEKGRVCRRGGGNEHRTLVVAEDAVVIAVRRDMWFKGRREGGEEVAPETGERENGRVVTGRERGVDDQIELVL